jgi:hypothetical protein
VLPDRLTRHRFRPARRSGPAEPTGTHRGRRQRAAEPGWLTPRAPGRSRPPAS